MPLTMHAVQRVAVAAIAATAALLAGCLLSAPSASAHDVLISTEPAQNSRVTAAPARVRLTFDKPALALGTEIRVTAADGALVSAGAPRLVDSDVTQDLAGVLPAGAYTVLWRVTSADGHPVTGRFTFTAEAAGTGALPEARRSVAGTGPAVRDSPAGAPAGGLWFPAAAVVIILAAGAAAATAVRRRRSDGTDPPG